MGRADRAGRGVRLVPGLAVRAGQTLAGKYRVEELVSAGACGVVLTARSIHLRKRVTLRILASYTDGQEEMMARRLAKTRLASRLKSSHLARIVDIGVTEDGMPFVATEHLEGSTLEEELAERGRLDVEEAARWVLEACEGLAEAHAAGLVHGDLKPQNIVLAEAAKPRRPSRSSAEAPPADTRVLKLLDFGTTSTLDAIGDQSASTFVGSPAFLAPEQLQDPTKVDARADVWALGVLLYDLISGALPFEADSPSGVMVAVVYDRPALLTDAPYELARLVSRCLEKDPSQRPRDVVELAVALAPFAGREGTRLAESVQAMLAAPPVSERSAAPPAGLADASASHSISPVSLSSSADGRDSGGHVPLAPEHDVSDVPRRDQVTLPSRRIMARRHASRARMTSLGLVAAAVLLVSVSTARPPVLLADSPESIAEAARTSARSRDTVVVVPPYVPSITPIAASTTAELADARPERSFAASASPDGVIATPLATAATPLATAAAPRWNALPPTPLPPPRTTTAPPRADATKTRAAAAPTSRLPAGLPTTRDALPPHGGPGGRPAARPTTTSTPATSRSDDTYLQKLFSERK